uniref:Uncharacterized protein n=1 Tax=Mycoplasma anserisalpingitidis TaxID=519450 RepID=A0A8F2DF28_9MOLU|nr:hypothetical protein [Mycoplasma anserisalpingitidis]
MRTTRNIEQVFSKISGFLIDVKYWIIKNNFYDLPNIQEICLKSNCVKTAFPIDYYCSANNKNAANENLYYIKSMVSFLEENIFRINNVITKNDEVKIKLDTLKSIKNIDIEDNKIVIHMLEINNKYIPFANVFALCCLILYKLKNQGYNFNLWSLNEKDNDIWEKIKEIVSKNKFVFRIYESQEEINKKFYKKFLLTDNKNIGVNYGVFSNIIGNKIIAKNISTKNKIINYIQSDLKNVLAFKCVNNIGLIYKIFDQWLKIQRMFSEEIISEMPLYAFDFEYWKTLFESVGSLLPFNIPEKDLIFDFQLKTKRNGGYYIRHIIPSKWIYNKEVFLYRGDNHFNLNNLVIKSLINKECTISDDLIQELISIGVINIPYLISKYGINKQKIDKASWVIKNEIHSIILI